MKLISQSIVIIICVVIYFFYISPTVSEVKVLSIQKSDYKNVINKAKELTTKRDVAFTSYNDIPQSDIDRLNKIIPETFDPIRFANDVSAMATGYGLTIKDFKVDEAKTDTRDVIVNQPQNQKYRTSVVAFGLTGSYPQFLKFLSTIESSLRLVDVIGLSMKSVGGNKGGDIPVQYLLKVNTYSLR
ncbi:MAG TPA: hypothetical protein VJG67_01595 [Candidatus Paceibacterota bacterium]